MPTVTQHAVGTFSWPELSTTDPAAAKKFYTSLFGWQFRDVPMGELGNYTILTLDGNEVGALTGMMPELQKQGVPPNWLSYVTVQNVDDSAKKAKDLGGTVAMGPFDVMDLGRMAVITDPQGATFSLWQPLKHIGVGVLDEPGSLGWTQLNAKDAAKAKPFYTGLLGWTSRDDAMPGEQGAYTTWLKGDGMAGGMMAMPANDPSPPHWLVFWAVRDVDASYARAIDLGARSFVPPTEIPGGMGRIAVLADPQGAVFALVKFAR